ncbi:MAG: response regulator transcription factor [Candidatus Bipolaricaulota bacterium]|nr:response regulator transcription factor [Candidatus Bipolaricaulota bacterium]MDW8030916.1 response regulator transcription factor [Candidatus Bipolaricaulota bacterium]
MTRRTFTALIALAALAVSLPTTLWVGARSSQEREREFMRSSEWMAKNLADQVGLQRRLLSDPAKLRAALTTMVKEFVVMDPVIYAQIVINGELVAQHQHMGDAGGVLTLPAEGAPARKLERKRLENGLEYLDIWRALNVGQTSEPVTSYVRLGVSLTLLKEATRRIYQGALLWAVGVALMVGFLAYLTWPRWAPRVRGSGVQHADTNSQTRESANSTLSFGQLVIDNRAKEVRLNGVALPLTPREYALLTLLVSEPGRVFSAQEIIERAWGTERFVPSEDVKKYVYLLRQKLERDPRNPTLIVTVRGFGYKFVPPER